MPGPNSRRDIWHIHLERQFQGRMKDAEFDFDRLVDESCHYSGAEIEEVVNSALLKAYNEDREVQTKDLLESLGEVFRLSLTMPKEIMLLRKWAEVRVRRASDENPEDLTPKIIDAKEIPKLKSERMSSPFVEENPDLRNP